MKNSKLLRIISFVLSLMLVLAAFAACNTDKDDNGDESSSISDTEGTPAETPAETPKETPVATPEETPAATPEETPAATPEETPAATPEETPGESVPEDVPTDAKIVVNGTSDYTIVKGDKSEYFESSAAQGLRDTLVEKTGASFTFVTDDVAAAKFEILVGKTTRAESIEVYESLRINDYAVVIKNNKVVIAALTEEKLNEAIAYFNEKLQIADGNATFLLSDEKTSKGTYSVESVTIGGKLLSNYTVVYAKNAEDTVKNAADLIATTFNTSYGYVVKVVADNTAATDYEIVVGTADRGEIDNSAMRVNDYKIFVDGNKIFIVGGSDKAVETAVNAFLAKLTEITANGKIEVTADNMNVTYVDNSFEASKVTLNGIDITKYTIIYSTEDINSKYQAYRLQDAISEVSGYVVKVLPDTSKHEKGSPEILVGYSKRMSSDTPSSMAKKIKALTYNNMLMYTDGDFFFMGGKNGNAVALIGATNRFINTLKKVENPDEHAIAFDYSTATKPNQTKYKVMTYNDGDNGWRTPSMSYRVNVINEFNPDIIGMQEVERQHAQPANAIQRFNSYPYLLPEYSVVYFDHEQPVVTVPYGNMILYKTEKFDLIDSGVQWLSDTPDVPNSMYDATDYIRTYVYAILRDKATGEEFVFISTHVDYIAEANVPQMHALISCTEKFRDKPIIFTGDFNMQHYSDGFKAMIEAGYAEAGRYLNPTEVGHIDFIFFDPKVSVATYYKCINDHVHSAGKPQAGSDHHPYVADIVLPS